MSNRLPEEEKKLKSTLNIAIEIKMNILFLFCWEK